MVKNCQQQIKNESTVLDTKSFKVPLKGGEPVLQSNWMFMNFVGYLRPMSVQQRNELSCIVMQQKGYPWPSKILTIHEHWPTWIRMIVQYLWFDFDILPTCVIYLFLTYFSPRPEQGGQEVKYGLCTCYGGLGLPLWILPPGVSIQGLI